MMAGLDNFCWCDPVLSEKNPDGAYKLAQLVRANEALYHCTTAYGVPCISGKDSMKNDYLVGDTRISIPPTLLFSVMARIDDARLAVTMDVKKAGDGVYLLGRTYPELGGSEYAAQLGGIGNTVPRVREQEALPRYRALARAMREGLVASCHDCSDGGLGVALAETAFAGGLGLEIDLRQVTAENIDREDVLLFAESQSRFVATVAPEKSARFEEIMAGTDCARIGTVIAEPVLLITGLAGSRVVAKPLADLKAAWQATLAF
jgi:phosphoribosylformylglycinamidine synthase subunit PurSL